MASRATDHGGSDLPWCVQRAQVLDQGKATVSSERAVCTLARRRHGPSIRAVVGGSQQNEPFAPRKKRGGCLALGQLGIGSIGGSRRTQTTVVLARWHFRGACESGALAAPATTVVSHYSFYYFNTKKRIEPHHDDGAFHEARSMETVKI